jgi:hypothetical protein
MSDVLAKICDDKRAHVAARKKAGAGGGGPRPGGLGARPAGGSRTR